MYNSVQLIDCTFFAVSHSPFTFFHALRDCQLGPRGLYISFIFWMTSNFQVIFLNYECFFPYWTLNWSFPFLLLWIYIYIHRFQIMFILFSWRLMCFFCFPMCSHWKVSTWQVLEWCHWWAWEVLLVVTLAFHCRPWRFRLGALA